MPDVLTLYEKIHELASLPDGEAHTIVLLEHYVRSNPKDNRAVVAYADALRVVGRSQRLSGVNASTRALP